MLTGGELVVVVCGDTSLPGLLGRHDDGAWRADDTASKGVAKLGRPSDQWLAFGTNLSDQADDGATLYLNAPRSGRVWRVVNIVPSARRSLSAEEYAKLLDGFAAQVLQPLEEQGLIQAMRSAAPIEPGLIYGARAAELLEEWAVDADPDAPLTAPEDLERFNRFVLSVHATGESDSTALRQWLAGSSGLGWRDSTVNAVVLAFERALALLDLEQQVA